MSECVECGKSDLELIDHHTNYKNNETVEVCWECHWKIHDDESHELFPDDPERADGFWRRSEKVRVSKPSWKALNAMKEPGESFDDVIGRLIDEHDYMAFEGGEP